MDAPKSKVGALILCFIFGPFGLFYVDKKGGIILSVLMFFTLAAGFAAIVVYLTAHPPTLDDLRSLEAGQMPGGISGLASILYWLMAVLGVQWLASMIWAYRSAQTDK